MEIAKAAFPNLQIRSGTPPLSSSQNGDNADEFGFDEDGLCDDPFGRAEAVWQAAQASSATTSHSHGPATTQNLRKLETIVSVDEDDGDAEDQAAAPPRPVQPKPQRFHGAETTGPPRSIFSRSSPVQHMQQTQTAADSDTSERKVVFERSQPEDMDNTQRRAPNWRYGSIRGAARRGQNGSQPRPSASGFRKWMDWVLAVEGIEDDRVCRRLGPEGILWTCTRQNSI